MFRNFTIRFRITLLVLVMTAIAVAFIGTYVQQTTDRTSLVYAGIVICSFAGAMALVYSRSLTHPMNSLTTTLKLISKGELPEKLQQRFPGEFGNMQTRVDDLVQVLQANAGFAQKVGEGKFDAPFKPASEND